MLLCYPGSRLGKEKELLAQCLQIRAGNGVTFLEQPAGIASSSVAAGKCAEHISSRTKYLLALVAVGYLIV